MAASVSGTGTAAATHSYSYGDSNWKDKLTAYDGSAITYDAIGNPLSYIGGWNFTWEQGRRLSTASNGSDSISYKYNSDGIRTSKTVNGTTTNFYLDDGDIAWQSDGTNTLHFAYDGSGSLTYLNYNGQIYYYERNAQNDVVGLVDSNMNEVVTYSYDTWGQLLNIGGSLAGTLGKLNPFRYRGYYYDSETGLYYLNSRYYDPNTGRFINADGNCGQTGNLLAANMFAYCKNNPVNMSDPKGDSPIPDCILNDMQLSRIARIAPKYKATKKKKSAGSLAANVAVDTAKNAAEGVADTEVSSAISKLPDVKYGVGRFGPGVGMTLKYADNLESVLILKGVSKTTGVIG